MKKFVFVFFFLSIDLLLSQFFLLDIIDKKIITANKESFENRVFNKNYKYTFKKLKTFTSHYEGNVYTISTNDLGFRYKKNIPIDRNKTYSIVIGDSFVEGVGLNYEDTIVGLLNNNLKKENNFEFLNAGVASYSSYIYLKKIKNIIQTNNNLKIKDIIVFLDKSDVSDDQIYLSRPNSFENTKGKFINNRKQDFYKDLKELSLWRFYTKQTLSGKLIKILTDKLEDIVSNISKRYFLAKKLNKNFFQISSLELKAIKSINNKPHIKNWYTGDLWEKKSKKNIDFAVENLNKLKKFLEKKDINLKVVLYPWSFEIENKMIRERYLDYILPLLNKNKIKTFVVYDDFLTGNIYENIGNSFLYNDIHYNSNGNKIIVNFLINNIE
tara:strand:- start:304 stop:1452 length:1149 start_codon:yes stop_codon:yes gene_type:complete